VKILVQYVPSMEFLLNYMIMLSSITYQDLCNIIGSFYMHILLFFTGFMTAVKNIKYRSQIFTILRL
jgi:hypothetical protein